MFLFCLITNSIFRYLLAFGNVFLCQHALFRVGIFVDEAVALVFGILKAFQLLCFYALLCQFKLAFHQQYGKVFAQPAIRIILQSVLRSDDTSLVVVAAKVAIAKVSAQVVIQFGCVQFLFNQLVLQVEESLLSLWL